MKLRYLQAQPTKSGTKYAVQIGVGRRCVYLGRFSNYDEAAALADASYYHAVVSGALPRVAISALNESHFNNWDSARVYVEGGAERAPAVHPKLASALAELRSEAAQPKVEVADFRADYPELAAVLDKLQAEVAELKRGIHTGHFDPAPVVPVPSFPLFPRVDKFVVPAGPSDFPQPPPVTCQPSFTRPVQQFIGHVPLGNMTCKAPDGVFVAND